MVEKRVKACVFHSMYGTHLEHVLWTVLPVCQLISNRSKYKTFAETRCRKGIDGVNAAESA